MTFTTPCFVRVGNTEERKELINYCIQIGYIQKYDFSETNLLVVAGYENGTVVDVNPTDEELTENLLLWGFFDCGTNVPLFKALAAMNDENSREQWFVNDMGLWHKASGDKCFVWTVDELRRKHFFYKASVEEIVEHFKNKEA